jgi:hypothetical protein
LVGNEFRLRQPEYQLALVVPVNFCKLVSR